MLYRHADGTYTVSSASPEGPSHTLTKEEGDAIVLAESQRRIQVHTEAIAAEAKLLATALSMTGFVIT